MLAVPCQAQVTPAAGYTPPDDTPAIRLGATIFADYTVQTKPKVTDVDGNEISLSQFNVQRAYLNVTGQINHIVQFRVTPDVARETTTGSALLGSYTYRLKYAYAQFNLDDWMARGSWARFGMQQTPWVDFMETVYRYRFQGTIFEDREGFLSSSDFGGTFRYNFPGNYGDVHTGFYNGDNYNRIELSRSEGVHDPRHVPAASPEQPSTGTASDRLLRSRRVRAGRRTEARNLRGHVRAPPRQRGVRLSVGHGSAAARRA